MKSVFSLVVFSGLILGSVSAQARVMNTATLTHSAACCCEIRGRDPNGNMYYANCALEEIDFGGSCEKGFTFWTRENQGTEDLEQLKKTCEAEKMPKDIKFVTQASAG